MKLSETQAQTINPGVFSRSQTEESSEEFTISLQGGSFSPTSWPNTTVTVANNLDRLEGVTTIDLSQAMATVNSQQQPITSLEGGVLFGNESITKLVLPATASNWKLTEPTNYQTAPVGWLDGQSQGSQNLADIEFLNFKNDNSAATSFETINWNLVAAIMNMFGYVDGSSGKDENLLAWSEGFGVGDLDAESVKMGWENSNSDHTLNGSEPDNTPYTLTVNNLTWKYTSNGSNSITLTTSSQQPNLYRAGYTNNPYATYQVGFGESDNKINKDTQVNVTLTLVKNG